MHLRHKNKDSLFIQYRKSFSGGEKAPGGAHLVAPSLESVCFMYLTHKNKYSLVVEYRRCISGGEKNPAGAHLDAPSLDNT